MGKRTNEDAGRVPATTHRMWQLQELWRAAATAPVILECGDARTASNLRAQLYYAVKVIRENPQLDPELAEIVDRLSISTVGEKKARLEIGPSEVAAVIEHALQALQVKR